MSLQGRLSLVSCDAQRECPCLLADLAEPEGSRARRRKLQPVLLSNLNDARNVLMLLWTHNANFLKESLETRRRDDAHEPAGGLAEIAVSVGDAPGRENRRALLGDECPSADGPFIFAFENLERLVFAMM